MITNVELDHTDVYKDLADVEAMFGQLGRQTQKTVWITMADQQKCFYRGDGTARIGIYGYELMQHAFTSWDEPLPSVDRYFANGTQSLDILEQDGAIKRESGIGFFEELERDVVIDFKFLLYVVADHK